MQVAPRRPNQGHPLFAKLPGNTTTTTASPVQSSSTDCQDSAAMKDYVNARLVRQPQRCLYVPLPAKRATLEGRALREYANCSLSDQSPGRVEEPDSSRPAEEAKAAVYDDVNPSKTECGPVVSGETAPTLLFNPTASDTSSDPTSPNTEGSGDYEVMDFGESSASVDEVFETVNYQLVAAGGSADQQQQQGTRREVEGQGRRDLDVVAQQVFQACRDYLQQGSDGADVKEVASRVAVAPQGLRTRERRNSYRQAVNHLLGGDTAPPEPQPGQPPLPPTGAHKYETIWFDSVRQLARGSGHSPGGPSQEQEEPHGSPAEDFWANLDLYSSSSSKEMLFREKLEELHSLVAGLGKPGRPEEDGPSKGSGSGSGSQGSSLSSLWHAPEAPSTLELQCSGASQQPSSPQGTDRGAAGLVGQLCHTQPDTSLQNGSLAPSGLWSKPLASYSCALPTLSSCPPHCSMPPPEGIGLVQEPPVVHPPHYSLAQPRNTAAGGKGSAAPHTKLPPVIRSRLPHPHPQEVVLAGDVAYVGEECVPLRQGRADVALCREEREACDTPLAPPRVKRTSFIGTGRPTGASDSLHGSPQQQWCLSIARDASQHNTHTLKQVEVKREDEAPPAIPAKTAAAFEFLDSPPDPVPPCSPPPIHLHYTHLPPPKPLPSSAVSRHQAFPATPVAAPQRQPTLPQLSDGELLVGEETGAGCSSSDSSDEEGIFHKFSAPSIFRRWRSGGSGGNSSGGGGRQVAPASPKSTFYEGWDDPIEPPTSVLASPKPLAKAFGKLRINSRSMAANFKSYLSQRSGQTEAGEGEAPGKTNGFPSITSASATTAAAAPWRPIQKSVSSGATLSPFTQVAQDYKYPNAIPKKPAGPRELPVVLRGPAPAVGVDGPVRVKLEPPRQQYL